MPSVAFPTAPPPCRKVGYPVEAEACPCGHKRLVYDHECLWCGLLPGHVIRATWAKQASSAMVAAWREGG